MCVLHYFIPLLFIRNNQSNVFSGQPPSRPHLLYSVLIIKSTGSQNECRLFPSKTGSDRKTISNHHLPWIEAEAHWLLADWWVGGIAAIRTISPWKWYGTAMLFSTHTHTQPLPFSHLLSPCVLPGAQWWDSAPFHHQRAWLCSSVSDTETINHHFSRFSAAGLLDFTF